MLTVYVCDDIAEQAEYYCRIINRFLLFKDWDIQPARAFSDPSLLLKEVTGDSDTGLYFLDIDLKAEMDGFSLAKKLREMDPRGFLIFLTAHSEYVHLAFQHRVEAMDYIVKSRSETVPQRITDCVAEAYGRYTKSRLDPASTLCLKTMNREIYLDKKQILYFTTSSIPHQIRICTAASVISVYGNLTDYEIQLGEGFIRIHKNCIVNRDHILELNRGTHQVIMKDGSALQASVRCWKKLTAQRPPDSKIL